MTVDDLAPHEPTARERAAMQATNVMCPSWCIVPEVEHVEELDQWDGRAVHHGERNVDDWSLGSVTWPDGTPAGEPGQAPVTVVRGSDRELSPDEVRQYALRLLELADQADR